MPIPFGVGVGDFLAVGKLIGQIAVELRENGEASPEYQSLLLELEALSRALHQLENLQPAKHELIQLNTIRATALTCQRPLERFLTKISKFEGRLGTFNARNNRYKGFSRRMQWRMMYEEDVKQLRSILGSHVATINLLLMTQTVGSVAAAENDRERLACGLENKIIAHRRLLEDVKGQVEVSLEQQLETKLQLRDHSVVLDNLGSKADRTHKQLQDQEALIQDVQTVVTNTREQTTSILATAIDILALATAGVMTLRLIAGQLSRIFELCTRLTTDMRAAMSNLMQLFFSLHTILRRIETSLPRRVNLPIVQFTDALGETMALPYQLCQQWETFRELLGVMFNNKPGKSRVEMGQYLIMNARGGRLLREASWQHAIKQDDHLSMSIVLDDLEAKDGCCPFPSCQASIEGVEVKNGGRTCPECGRWAMLTPRKPSNGASLNDPVAFNLSKPIEPESKNDEKGDWHIESEKELEEVEGKKEDIEVYRQIHVQVFDTSPSSSDNEGEKANALLRVQRRRQSSKRHSQITMADGPVFRPLDILICEDHPVSKVVMEKLLEKLGCRTISAIDGTEAMRYAMSEVKFDIIMMELKLPHVDGADVARVIRDTRNANSHTPIVAVTSYLKELMAPHYFDALIEKPPTTSKLIEVMSILCQWKALPPGQNISTLPGQYIPTSSLRQESVRSEDSLSSGSSVFA